MEGFIQLKKTHYKTIFTTLRHNKWNVIVLKIHGNDYIKICGENPIYVSLSWKVSDNSFMNLRYLIIRQNVGRKTLWII